jgi:Na+/phosphate symporter
VLTVISGWFLTAIVAFTVSAGVAFALMYGGVYAIIGSIGLVVFLFVQFAIIHKKREAKQDIIDLNEHKTEHDIIVECTKEIEQSVKNIIHIYQGVLDGLFAEDRKALNKLYKMADEFHGRSKRRRLNEVLPTIQKLEHQSLDTAQYYVQAVDYFYEISMSLRFITESSYKFIDNAHEGFTKEQIEDLRMLGTEFIAVYSDFNEMIQNNDYSGLATIKERRATLLDLYSELVRRQIKRTKEKESGSRNTILYLNILNETKVIAMKSVNLMRAQMNMYNSDDYIKIMK